MDNRIENIIVTSNLLEVTKAIIKNVGFEYQAPLDDATLDEIISSQVLSVVGSEAAGGAQ